MPEPRYDPAMLRYAAGERGFQRGAKYLEEGRVVGLRIERDRVTARVDGTDLYRVRLRGRGEALRADCDCPAYEDAGFCKHIVAVALAANAATGTETADPLAEVGAWLRAQPAEALAALLLAHAEEDEELATRLRTLAARALHPAKAEAELRRALDDQTHARALPAYRGVRAWANRVAETIGAIEDLAASDPAAGARTADHALDRITGAYNQIDDSDGNVLWLLGTAVEAHQAAVNALRPDPLVLAATLFRREMEDYFGLFDGAADAYADALGPAGRAEYRRLATAAWDALPPHGKGEPEPERRTLLAILDRFAAADDDLPARLALRRRDLGNATSYYRLAEFCLENGLAADALTIARDGVWLHDRDARLRDLLVDLLLAGGHRKEALDHLWRAFERKPDRQLYDRLRRHDGEPAVDRALALLEARLARGEPTERYSDPAHLLVGILTAESRFDRAWQLAAERGLDARALARASEASHPRQALAVYTAEVEALVRDGDNARYAAAVALLARMAELRPPSEHAAHLASLREAFHRRRNFIALLDHGALPGRSR